MIINVDSRAGTVVFHITIPRNELVIPLKVVTYYCQKSFFSIPKVLLCRWSQRSWAVQSGRQTKAERLWVNKTWILQIIANEAYLSTGLSHSLLPVITIYCKMQPLKALATTHNLCSHILAKWMNERAIETNLHWNCNDVRKKLLYVSLKFCTPSGHDS